MPDGTMRQRAYIGKPSAWRPAHCGRARTCYSFSISCPACHARNFWANMSPGHESTQTHWEAGKDMRGTVDTVARPAQGAFASDTYRATSGVGTPSGGLFPPCFRGIIATLGR